MQHNTLRISTSVKFSYFESERCRLDPMSSLSLSSTLSRHQWAHASVRLSATAPHLQPNKCWSYLMVYLGICTLLYASWSMQFIALLGTEGSRQCVLNRPAVPWCTSWSIQCHFLEIEPEHRDFLADLHSWGPRVACVMRIRCLTDETSSWLAFDCAVVIRIPSYMKIGDRIQWELR